MKNKRRPLASLIAGMLTIGGVGFAFAVPLVTAPTPALAASASCPPAMGMMNFWLFSPEQPGVVFRDTQGSGEVLNFPASVASIDTSWGGLDNPASLLWYAKNVPGSNTQLGMIFGCAQTYTSQLIATMNANHFAPSMVSGVNPPGITTGSPITGGSGTGGTKTETITVNASPVNYYVGGKLATPANGMFNNQNVVTVSDSFVYKKTTFVPIRFAAKLLGQPVAWNGTQYGVDITAGSTATAPPSSTTVLRAPSKPDIMQITVNATPMHFYVGGADKTPKGDAFDNRGVTTLDGFVYDKTTYVPIRLAAELLNQSIQWDSKHYSVDIGTP